MAIKRQMTTMEREAKAAADYAKSTEYRLTQMYDVIHAIQSQLDGMKWTPDTLDTIANILRQNGYSVRDSADTVCAVCGKVECVDEPCCPHCRHHNAMLGTPLTCRDCGYVNA